MEHWWNDTDKENPKYSEKNLTHVYVIITNAIWAHLGSKPFRTTTLGPTSNRLCHGTAVVKSDVSN
jgi:hypothetical protein